MQTTFRDYLNGFKTPLKNSLKHYIVTREECLGVEPPEFHSEINKQFYEVMAEELAAELSRNFQTNPEDIIQFMETFDIQEWLDG